jgi:adenylate kinase
MRRGELVSDEVVVAIVRERAGCLRCRGGFLLDGFPRTRAQAEALDLLLAEQGVTLDAVLSYKLPLEEIIARLSGRRTCVECKAVYNAVLRPPRAPGVCDHCGSKLI